MATNLDNQKCLKCGGPHSTVACAGGGGGGGEEEKEQNKASEADAMGKLLDLDNAKIPALSVSWCKGDTIHAVAAGSIKASEKLPRRVDTDTPFQAASLSKPVSAAMVLDLIAQKNWGFDLDTPLANLADYGPPEIQQDMGNYKKLTIGMVLGQHSGLPNWFWFDPKVGKEFIATPGEHFTYSGEAFDCLKRVIEKKTGRKWEEIAQDFFTKAGMTSSTFKQLPAIANRAVAIAHIARTDGTPFPVPPGPINAPEVPAGSLRTTAKDYITFLQYCFKNLKSIMLTGTGVYPFNPKKPLETSIAADQFQWGLGMGIYTDPKTNKTIAFHWGNNTGTRTFCAMDTETGDCVACFSNSENGPAVFQQIAKLIVGDIQPLFQWLAASGFKDANAPPAPDSIAKIVYSISSFAKEGPVDNSLEVTNSLKQGVKQLKTVIWASTISSDAKKSERFNPSPLETTPKQPCKNANTPKLSKL